MNKSCKCNLGKEIIRGAKISRSVQLHSYSCKSYMGWIRRRADSICGYLGQFRGNLLNISGLVRITYILNIKF